MQPIKMLPAAFAVALAACVLCFNSADAKKPDNPGGGGGGGEAAYSIVPFQPPDFVSISSRVADLNEVGYAVGYAEHESGDLQAFHLDIANDDYTTLQGGTEAFGVNNLNQIVGRTDIDGVTTALFWSSPAAAPLALSPLAGDAEADAFAINDAGIVVGRSWPAGGSFMPRGVVWRVLVDANGTMQVDAPLELTPIAGEIVSAAVDINEVIDGSAQAVGASYDGLLHEAVIWTVDLNPDGTLAAPGAPQDLGTLGLDNPSESDGWAINNFGDACGESDRWPFLAPANQFAQPLPTPRKAVSGLASNVAMDLSDTGDIVGRLHISKRGGAVPHAYLWRDGETIDLNTQIPGGSGWDQLSAANVINNTGRIAGWGELDGNSWAFVLIPNDP